MPGGRESTIEIVDGDLQFVVLGPVNDFCPACMDLQAAPAEDQRVLRRRTCGGTRKNSWDNACERAAGMSRRAHGTAAAMAVVVGDVAEISAFATGASKQPASPCGILVLEAPSPVGGSRTTRARSYQWARENSLPT